MTTYQPVSWSPGPITLANLQQMANNDEWMFENMPRMMYQGPHISKDNGLKIAAGRTTYAGRNSTYEDVTTYFNNFFTVGCAPVVVATVHSFGGLREYCTVRGLGNARTIDNRGFIAQIASHEDYSGKGYGVVANGVLNWIAVGW